MYKCYQLGNDYTVRKDRARIYTQAIWPKSTHSNLKDPDAGKDWKQEKETAEDEMVRWHHQLKGHEFEQALGVVDGQGSLACCSPWALKESDMTEWRNWLKYLFWFFFFCHCFFDIFSSIKKFCISGFFNAYTHFGITSLSKGLFLVFCITFCGFSQFYFEILEFTF